MTHIRPNKDIFDTTRSRPNCLIPHNSPIIGIILLDWEWGGGANLTTRIDKSNETNMKSY